MMNTRKFRDSTVPVRLSTAPTRKSLGAKDVDTGVSVIKPPSRLGRSYRVSARSAGPRVRVIADTPNMIAGRRHFGDQANRVRGTLPVDDMCRRSIALATVG